MNKEMIDKVKKILINNREVLDKYFEMEYNQAVLRIISSDDEKLIHQERGKLQYLMKIQSMMQK